MYFSFKKLEGSYCSPEEPKGVTIRDDSKKLSEHLRWCFKKNETPIKPFHRGFPLKARYSIREYQKSVLEWAMKRDFGILSIQMGLGKTFMGLCIASLSKKEKYPTLVVCPKNVVDEWIDNGVRKFFGSRLAYKVMVEGHSESELSTITKDSLEGVDFVITSYETVRKSFKVTGARSKHAILLPNGNVAHLNYPTLKTLGSEDKGAGIIHSIPWGAVIYDESQTVSNFRTQGYESCLTVYGEKKWCLTGTAVKNRAEDVWAQLRILNDRGIPVVAKEWKRYAQQNQGIVMAKLYSLTYEEANIKIPELHKVIVPVTMNADHYVVYKKYHDRLLNAIRDFEDQKEKYHGILAALTTLRLVAIHPSLVDPKYTKDFKSSKLVKMVEYLVDRVKKGKRVVVMSNFVKVLDLLGSYLEDSGIKYGMLTGETKYADRATVLQQFKTKYNVLLSTYKVGGVGLNLQFATEWCCVEPWWNNSIHRQGYQRVWRVGQTQECTASFFITERTIEGGIYDLCRQKEEISAFFKGQEGEIKESKLDPEIIRKMLKLDTSKIVDYI